MQIWSLAHFALHSHNAIRGPRVPASDVGKPTHWEIFFFWRNLKARTPLGGKLKAVGECTVVTTPRVSICAVQVLCGVYLRDAELEIISPL